MTLGCNVSPWSCVHSNMFTELTGSSDKDAIKTVPRAVLETHDTVRLTQPTTCASRASVLDQRRILDMP